jgi:hypothetical protein
MNLHQEVLPAEQVTVLRQLGPVAQTLGFYLGGGTAVAIHLGHRQSLDLDWFTGRTILDPLELAKDVQDSGVPLRVASAHRGTLHGDVRGVRVSFLESRYPLVRPTIMWSEFGCAIAAREDLAAMKLLAVAQRGTKKDFLDVHALCRHGIPLDHMLQWYREKFSVDDIARVVYSLCYFDDAEPAPLPTMLVPCSWDDVKQSLRQWVKAIAGYATMGGGARSLD